MKWRIRPLAFLLAALLLPGLLAGCGGGEPGIQELDAPQDRPEYLSFFSPDNMSTSDAAKYWIDRFTEEYNKQVYISFDGASYYADEGLSYRELLEKRMESSAPDELYIINAEDVLEFERKGYWLDLSGMDFVDGLTQAALYQSTYNDKVFSVPLSFTGFGFAWNVDMLQDHGLAIPQNLEEFLSACETLKQAGILPYGANKGYALTVPAMCAGLSPLYASQDLEADVSALNDGSTPISAYLRDGFGLLALMMERGYMDPRQALESAPRKEDLELFLSGGCAFICTGLGDISAAGEMPFTVEVTGVPVLAQGQSAVYGAVKRLCVNPDSKHLDTVLEFIEMVGTPEALNQSAAMDHTVSSAKEGDAGSHPGEEALAALLQQPGQIPNQDFALHFNTWESIRDVSGELCAGASVDQACALLDEKHSADLKAYRGEAG